MRVQRARSRGTSLDASQRKTATAHASGVGGCETWPYDAESPSCGITFLIPTAMTTLISRMPAEYQAAHSAHGSGLAKPWLESQYLLIGGRLSEQHPGSTKPFRMDYRSHKPSCRPRSS
jgi:hypothetical protein